jgi:glycosyltransferase involved in cell wall biosynthesis
MPDLQAFVAEHGLNADVLFTGPLPHAEVPPYLDLIDIAVQPAANEYCCPMKILEYMALGKPIIAPAQENIQELLTEKEAIFFTPRDADSLATALEALAHDRERSQEMGRNARAAIHKRGFLWTANAQRVLVLAAPRESGQFCATTSFRP